MIRALHSTAMDFVAHSDFDVVFVVENAADYAAFQSIRQAASNDGQDEARRLAELITGGDVALLLGAGVSISAGLPTWDSLLSQLKNTLLPDLDPEEFSELGVLDRAQMLANSSPSKALGHSVSNLIKSAGAKKPTLSHCLLASLNVAKVVTTNYDSLYEDAFNAAHRSASISVLPRGDVVANQPWLLKMHGDVEDPDSIVLSRRDFVQYDAERRPLGSIVQSLMSTGHLVVIGASMTDDNVLRLAHEVLAMNARYDQERVLGTVITLRPDAIRSALWKGDFDFIPASRAPTDRIAARDLEILLDRIAMHASEQSRYLLDPRYAELLAENEQRLARTLRDVAGAINGLPTEKKKRWTALSMVISELGHTPNSG
ncbi:SIR2 family protein [Rhodococcus fascians]|uniref:SIR2 family protein n=1 Tax=Rhodococcoides fascians TaxID=1828 RepID=UPI0019612ACB|nr:SIR2 family protein [Rhodococcus fascians]MBM7245177.1 SIR2 family protein [Rhodococcus fascians]MBY3811074.1 SIR2 family protein [Rhodococcus fascians]MBY3842577.1 SIR2 family protein [Rhodococcus fascians]MBY3845486.1 SIR2 family protein [Rhodococcus fascians]MBY3851782.1 SIR2 family protein [Rhodococcus fascians]